MGALGLYPCFLKYTRYKNMFEKSLRLLSHVINTNMDDFMDPILMDMHTDFMEMQDHLLAMFEDLMNRDENEKAIRIQKVFRGHVTRKWLKRRRICLAIMEKLSPILYHPKSPYMQRVFREVE